MSSTTPKIEEGNEDFKQHSSYRKDFPGLKESIGHVPDYDEEQESEIPDNWFEPLKD
jgi:hypothetical protein